MADLDLGTIKATIDANTNAYERAMRDMQRLTKSVTKQIETDSNKTSASVDKLGQSAKDAAKGFAAFKGAGAALKFSAIASGASGASGAITALSAGATQAAGSLYSLSGAIVGLPIVLGAAASAFATVKLGFEGVGKAAKAYATGDAAKVQKATVGMTDGAKSFAKELASLQPVLKVLKTQAQGGLMPGAEYALKSAVTLAPLAAGHLRDMGNAIGGVAVQFGNLLKSSQFQADLGAIMGRNVTLTKTFGTALVGLTGTFASILAAAGPMYGLIDRGTSNMSARFAEFIARTRAGGSLTQFFADSAQSARSFGDIVGSTFAGLASIFETIRPYSQGMLEGLQGITNEFQQWSKSEGGRASIMNWMRDSQPLLSALGGLFTTVTKSIAAIGKAAQKDMLPLVASLNDKLIPAFTQLAITTGPALLTGISDFAAAAIRIFMDVPRSLTVVVQAVAKLAEGLAALVDLVPTPLLQAFAAYVTVTRAAAVATALWGKSLNTNLVVSAWVAVTRLKESLLLASAVMRASFAMSFAAGLSSVAAAAGSAAAGLGKMALAAAPLAILATLAAGAFVAWNSYKDAQSQATDSFLAFKTAVNSGDLGTASAGITKFKDEVAALDQKMKEAEKTQSSSYNPLKVLKAAAFELGADDGLAKNQKALAEQQKQLRTTETAINAYAESQVKGTQAQMDYHNNTVLTGEALATFAPIAQRAGVVVGDSAAQVTAKMEAYKASIAGIPGATTPVVKAFQDIAGGFIDADTAASNLKSALDSLMGVFVSKDAAIIAFKESIVALSKTIGENGNTIDLNTKAGRENVKAVGASVTAYGDVLVAATKAGAGPAELTKMLNDNAAELRKTATASGLTKDKIGELLARYKLTPEAIKTQVQALGIEQAKAGIKAVTDAIGQLNGKTATVTTLYRSVGAPGAAPTNRTVGVGGGVLERAEGGRVWGPGSGTSDSISARLSNGEYVIKAATANKLGTKTLDAINQGYASGGVVGGYATGGAISNTKPGIMSYAATSLISVKERAAAYKRATDSPLTKATEARDAARKIAKTAAAKIAASRKTAMAAQAQAKIQQAQANVAKKALDAAKKNLDNIRQQIQFGSKSQKKSAQGKLQGAQNQVKALTANYSQQDKEAKAAKKSMVAREKDLAKVRNTSKGLAKDAAEAQIKLADEVVGAQIDAAQKVFEARKEAAIKFLEAETVAAEASKKILGEALAVAEANLQKIMDKVNGLKDAFRSSVLAGMDLGTVFGNATAKMQAAQEAATKAQEDYTAAVDRFNQAQQASVGLTAELIASDANFAKVSNDLQKAKSDLAESSFVVAKFNVTGTGSAEDLLAAYEAMWAAQSNVVDSQSSLNDIISRGKELQDSITASAKDMTAAMTAMAAAQAASVAKSVNIVGDMLTQFRDKLTASKAFAERLGTLTGMGLSANLVTQLAAMGPVAGLAFADALIAAGVPAITELNSLTDQLNVVADTGMNVVADTLYGAAVAAATAIVDGLKSQMAALDAVIAEIAAKIAKIAQMNFDAANMNVDPAAGVNLPNAPSLPAAPEMPNAPTYPSSGGTTTYPWPVSPLPIAGPGTPHRDGGNSTTDLIEEAARKLWGTSGGSSSTMSGATTAPFDVAAWIAYGNNYGGARAKGGPVSAASTYLVGEKGPELFTPSSSGYVVPNSSATAGYGSGSSGSTITIESGAIQVSVSGDSDAREVEDAVTMAFTEMLAQMRA